ncbi:hyaluronan mediated motility receptor isoform X2 [Kryptolebias marmoratus]|uniref:Hyaluronan-mediated motility receptor (RHAMM) n=1 Tax=Kryptolebias marmoratus TaxID=37003 RepID=A0A3Q3GGI8_KRYMA|nr:hyaluronan mediated motility receptor isoform X2 [Kryptolebias marmoratus]
MSFSRAPLKRFNEHVGCAPPPGTYEIKSGDPKGAASFDKSDRFRPVKAASEAALLPPPPSPSRSVFVSPVRRTLSVDGLVTGGSGAKKDRNGMSLEMKQQKLLEREIRSLVQQRGEQDRRMLVLEEELKKVEAKLQAAVREKTGLTASVITLERQRAELKKINEFLKNKVSADTTKKRINSLTMELMEARNHLDAKNQELSLLQINSEGQLKALEIDLQAARATASALSDRNKDLEDLHQVTKTQNEDMESENARLSAVIQELREEIRVLQGYLDEANDQIQELRLKIEEKTQENMVAGSQVEKLKKVEMQLETAQVLLRQREEEAQRFQEELQASQDVLREAEQRLERQEAELGFAQKSVIDMEKQMRLAGQEAQDSQATVRQQEAELARLREVLRRTERELDERVAHLEQRCLFSEEERSKTQEEGLRRIEELKMELNLLQQTKQDEKKRQIQLEQEHAALTEELAKEKALVDSLTALVEQEREESEEHTRQLREEMEEVLGELAVMEEQELKRQEVAADSQEVIRKLQQEKKELERQLNALLQGDVVSVKELHLAAVRELQEANADSQKKTEAVVSELESTKEELRGANERRRELEAEVERVTRQLTEAMDKMVEQREEEVNRLREWTEEHQERLVAEERAKEENSKILLEVQARLARKDEEMKAAEVSHAAQMAQLQRELQMQINETGEALGCLEEQRNQSLTQLQHEREEARKVLEEISRQKAEIVKQLHEEKEEKVKIQRALEEEKAALEVERKNHEQVRSEAQTLHAELEKLNEERGSFLSEVELKEFSRVLEDQRNAAEQDRDRLRARLDDAEQEKVNLQAQLKLAEEKARALERELGKHGQEKLALGEQVEALTQEKVALRWEMEEQRHQLQRQLAEVQEKSSSQSELERWRKQYEELFAKVRPFQEQLNAFAAERAALLNENGTNQEELNKLANAYASLLGHQNQKQKIKHVMKLKDENISLKQEVSKLRSLASRQKSDLEQLKAKLPGTPRRRFDPSKAFQHDKENRRSEATKPLKEGNHTE